MAIFKIVDSPTVQIHGSNAVYMTGIYPLDNYFGVKKTDLMSVEQLVTARLEKEKRRAEHIRAQREAREKELSLSTFRIMARDQKKIQSEIRKWERMEDVVEQQLKKLHELYEKTKKAVQFYNQADADTLEALKDPQNWKNYKEFDYVNELGALY